MRDRICDTSHSNTVALNASHNNTIAFIKNGVQGYSKSHYAARIGICYPVFKNQSNVSVS